MKFLVQFRSHTMGVFDAHFVSLEADSFLEAILKAKKECPPLFPWVSVRAVPFPKGCASLAAAVQKAKTRAG